MEGNHFEERYRNGDTPWDHGMVDFNLVEAIAAHGIRTGRALDIGCGTGDNAIWLAQQGFDVTACDLSETAIGKAREKAAQAGVECRFWVGDFLALDLPVCSFSFVFDRGCLHCMPDAGWREGFAAKVAELLEADGWWLSLAGNADEPKREVGPPQLTATALVSLVEPLFEVVSLASGRFGSDQETPPRAWIALLRKRAVAAGRP